MFTSSKNFVEPSSHPAFYHNSRLEPSAFEQWFEEFNFHHELITRKREVYGVSPADFHEYLSFERPELIDSLVENVMKGFPHDMITAQGKWLNDMFERFIESKRSVLEANFNKEAMKNGRY